MEGSCKHNSPARITARMWKMTCLPARRVVAFDIGDKSLKNRLVLSSHDGVAVVAVASRFVISFDRDGGVAWHECVKFRVFGCGRRADALFGAEGSELEGGTEGRRGTTVVD